MTAQIELPETEPDSGDYVLEAGKAYGPSAPHWSFGPSKGRRDSFYCTHISSVQRLQNGNTLITQGPHGIVTEVRVQQTPQLPRALT